MPVALIAGVDEAGRGPLAGPVVAACVLLDPAHPIAGLADSKTLSSARREALAACIREHALAWAIGEASVAEIDELNILRATLLAMARAVDRLSVRPDEVLVDGLHCPAVSCRVRAVIRGDATVPSISAASILAKTVRDATMIGLHAHHPGYGFDRHKGYPTAAHVEALRRLGPVAAHRRSFAPVRAAIAALG
jgi:ribonuclease HII